MPRQVGPEREHFGGEDGLHTEIAHGKTRFFWKCNFCNWELGGQNFQNSKARIHLSGDASLRNGMISVVCPLAPDDVKRQFTLLEQIEQTKRMETALKRQKRKRGMELLNCSLNSPSTKQTKLRAAPPALVDDDVDDSWGEAFFWFGYCSLQNLSPSVSRGYCCD